MSAYIYVVFDLVKQRPLAKSYRNAKHANEECKRLNREWYGKGFFFMCKLNGIDVLPGFYRLRFIVQLFHGDINLMNPKTLRPLSRDIFQTGEWRKYVENS